MAACVVVHGLGDSMEGWRPFVPVLLPPDVTAILVNAPTPYYGGYSWYPIPGMTSPSDGPEDMLAGIRASRALLAELVTHVLQELGMSADQVLLLGFSQGCCMVLETALRSDHRFAGVVGISGLATDLDDLPEGLGAAAREQAIIWTCGRHDPVIPVEWVQATHEAVSALDVATDFRVYAKAHEVDPEQELPELQAWIAERVGAVSEAHP